MATMYLDTAAKKLFKEFFEDLTTYFLTIDVSEFNPREIPETETKKDLINASRSPLEMWIIEHYDELLKGIKCSDASVNKPKEMKLKHFQNAISTYCDKVRPTLNGKKSSCFYYKLKKACEAMFKPGEEDLNGINIDGLLSDDEE